MTGTDPMPERAAVRRAVERLRDLPTLPAVVERVGQVLERPDADLAEAAAIIETDQVLTAQLLRLANSAFYGVSGRIGSVTQALTVLGTTLARSLLYGTSVLDLRINLTGFWEHAIGVAVASGVLAKRLRLPKPEEVSGAGLLHDLGKVVLYKQAPEAFGAVLATAAAEGVPFGVAERRLLGLDHTEVASWLLTRWKFPARVVEPVVCHHAPERARGARAEAAVVHVANALVRAYGYGFGGDAGVPAIAEAAWTQLGLGAPELDAALAEFERDLDAALHGARFAGTA